MASEAFSYTRATGKRPSLVTDGMRRWTKAEGEQQAKSPDRLPGCIHVRLMCKNISPYGFWAEYFNESDAMRDADAAYLKAVSDGAIEPITPNP